MFQLRCMVQSHGHRGYSTSSFVADYSANVNSLAYHNLHARSSTSDHRLSHPPLDHRRILRNLLVVQTMSVQARLIASIHSNPRALNQAAFVYCACFRRFRNVCLACQDGKVAGSVLLDVEDAVVEGFAAEHGPVYLLAGMPEVLGV